MDPIKNSVELQDDSKAENASVYSGRNDVELRKLTTLQVDDEGAGSLSPSHREYLLQRHGTLALDPLPSADPADPYNWPSWKKQVNLLLVAIHACMTTFFAAGIIPAFEDIATDLGVTITSASYLTSAMIAVLGFSPLVWKPLSSRYGRRPIWLLSTSLSGVMNITCGVSQSYNTMMFSRCLLAFFISPAMAIGSGVVVETFFKKERGRYMGIWTLMVTLGPPGGPFVMGFVAQHLGYRWIYWIDAIICAVLFVAYFFLGPETRYIRGSRPVSGSAFRREYLSFRRIDPTPFHAIEFISPLFLARYTSILIPTIAHMIVFGYASVLATVEIPQIFIPKFHLDPQALGIQFIGLIIGSIIGEQLGGPLSDVLINRRTKKMGNGQRPEPEFRLLLSHLGFALSILGLVLFGVQVNNATQGVYNVSPVIMIGIAGAGNQIITTVLISYAVDCHPEHSTSIGVFVNFVRSTWGFFGGFWFPVMIEGIGILASGFLMGATIFGVSVVAIVIMQFFGRAWRLKATKTVSLNGGRGD